VIPTALMGVQWQEEKKKKKTPTVFIEIATIMPQGSTDHSVDIFPTCPVPSFLLLH
jgi:hypothetical protein